MALPMPFCSFTLPLSMRTYVLTNEDCSRAFLCIGVNHRPRSVEHLLDRVDHVLQTFDKPTFYQERDLHVSLASWVLPPAVRGSSAGAFAQLPSTVASRIDDTLQV